MYDEINSRRKGEINKMKTLFAIVLVFGLSSNFFAVEGDSYQVAESTKTVASTDLPHEF